MQDYISSTSRGLVAGTMRDVVAAITKAESRKRLFHFTRASNLPAIAHYDALLSSHTINPFMAGDRRLKAMKVSLQNHSITLNAHLKIPDSLIDASITQEQFRACLDSHVFFWPTVRDCQKMMETYTRREPEEGFAVLEFNAYSLLIAHYGAVKLSKYDSGSSPRFPARCLYKKSPDILLPINQFKMVSTSNVPAKPSEIKEIVIEEQVNKISQYLQAVYIEHDQDVPERWKRLIRPLASFQDVNEK
jgi:hypothetical protein